jgi:hypothetical protein
MEEIMVLFSVMMGTLWMETDVIVHVKWRLDGRVLEEVQHQKISVGELLHVSPLPIFHPITLLSLCTSMKLTLWRIHLQRMMCLSIFQDLEMSTHSHLMFLTWITTKEQIWDLIQCKSKLPMTTAVNSLDKKLKALYLEWEMEIIYSIIDLDHWVSLFGHCMRNLEKATINVEWIVFGMAHLQLL